MTVYKCSTIFIAQPGSHYTAWNALPYANLQKHYGRTQFKADFSNHLRVRSPQHLNQQIPLKIPPSKATIIRESDASRTMSLEKANPSTRPFHEIKQCCWNRNRSHHYPAETTSKNGIVTHLANASTTFKWTGAIHTSPLWINYATRCKRCGCKNKASPKIFEPFEGELPNIGSIRFHRPYKTPLY